MVRAKPGSEQLLNFKDFNPGSAPGFLSYFLLVSIFVFQ